MREQAPWPEAIGAALCEPGANRSLLFDRGFRGFERDGNALKVPPQEKAAFLRDIAAFQGDLSAFLARRKQSLESLGAQPLHLVSATPLVVGLGLPSPLETGFLFDRLTGCPYLAGSSVRGLARATARLVAKGELEGDRAYWTEALERSFGPFGDGEAGRRKGRLVFYDAFPCSWPRLSVDVLTPHYGPYYRDPSRPPADWEDPVPVQFLHVAPGTAFTFWVGAVGAQLEETEQQQVLELLRLGLDWLGIGGKRSQGYGAFGSQAPPPPAAPPTAPRSQPKPPKPASKPESRGNLSAKNLAELSKFLPGGGGEP